ncbi:peptidoglycan D,D-transpeptidase FtsI family protein [Planctomicrobium piriforme]|uniref:beta-lactamase n=1 Tax=Planctomicrobium piriforme TaxID=1576369 RepID=A0A1I3B4B7_9PLAN|nr:penicillin-binding transpeptidase domain-containing protein [Planctomicrobium piriforme]SFH56561.1 penicillin-binding protein 2 [Planctomicrobium piriforme]
MRNQPFSSVVDERSGGTGTADRPQRRPLILAAIILCCQIPIALRLVHVQAVIGERFIAPWRAPIVDLEQVPARDGRIVSRDGVVLAQDEVQYDIAVEYRWLQHPPDERWIKRQAYRSLSSQERKNPQLRAAAESRLLAHREQLLESLSQVTGTPRPELVQEMAGIQKRIETMLAAVERRRQERAAASEGESFDWSQGMSGLARVVMQELTRPPDRFADDPIVLKEELQDHVVLRNVPLQVVTAIQSQPSRFQGVHVRSTSTRTYPRGDLAAHVIGIRRRPAAESVTSATRQGESGVERFRDAQLHGQPGEVRHTKDRHGELLNSEVVQKPRDGAEVLLTIDSQLQQLAEQLLDTVLHPARRSLTAGVEIPRGACLIAMDVWTGDIVAMASGPRPSLPVLARPTAEEWTRLQQDTRQPLFSRSTQMSLPPGSIFKLVTAIAALETGAVSADEVLHCQGYLNEPDRYRCLLFRQQGVGHGQLHLDEALSQSCHVCFHELARRMGPEPLCDWATRLGLGRATGVDLPGEHRGKLPPPPATGSRQGVTGATLQLGVGQGAILVSPLQVARLLAAVANGGYLVTPHVARTAVNEESPTRSFEKVPGLSAATLETVRRGLEMAVHDPRGVAYDARVELLQMAAMSGTADVPEKADHAWFAGYAPAQNPRVAVVVVLEHGGAGENAGPIFRDFVTELLGYGELRPSPADPRQTKFSPRR